MRTPLSTEQKYDRLVRRNKYLETELKIMRNFYTNAENRICKLEAEILDINTNTINEIIINSNKFNNN